MGILVRTVTIAAFAWSSMVFASDSIAEQSSSLADRPALEKSYFTGGALNLVGTVGYSISNAAGTITMTADEIANDALSGTSGSIMLAVIVTINPIVPGEAFSYWTVGRRYLPPLAWNYHYTDYSTTVSLDSVPDGIYYIHLGIFEYEQNCGSNSGYCSDEIRTFSTRIQVNGGVFTNYTPPATQTTLAVEYFNAGFGHYFVTADPAEIAGLDGGAYNFAFQRTGQTFKVYISGAGVDVCRFFTTPGTFGTKSSHFYTAVASECNGLKTNPNWIYEKIAGRVILPTAGGCPAGHQLLYRLYNSGITGAPNHRYTTSLTIRSQMMQQGFVPEDANSACVPL
jgi:hypothetical protein